MIADLKVEAEARVPAEPDGAATDVITLRFQTRQVRLNRKFLSSHKVQALIDYAHGQGFPPTTHLLATSRPRKVLDESLWGLTLAELGLPKRDVIMIEEV